MSSAEGSVFGFDPQVIPWSIPKSLDRKQRRLLTSMRYAYEFMTIAHRRLVGRAREINQPDRRELTESNTSLQVRSEMMMYAWTIADNLNRLRRLLHFSNELSDQAVVIDFIESTASVKNLRDVIQHFDRDYDKADDDLPTSNILGSLTWIDYRDYHPSLNGTAVTVCMIRAGPNSTRSRNLTQRVEIDRDPNADVFDFCLYAHGHSANLSKLVIKAVYVIELFSASLEKGWMTLVAQKEEEGSPLESDQLERWHPDWIQSQKVIVNFE